MYFDVDQHDLTRRELLKQGGLFLGAAALLAGCQSAPVVTTARLPEPLYPDREPPGSPLNLNPHAAPAPQPMPTGPQIAVIPRSRWTNAQPIMSREAYAMNGINRITVHHDAIVSTDVQSVNDSVKRLNSVRVGHLQRNMVDIGYHYVIDPAGRVWEARPTRLQGGHVHNQNENNLGIMVMGNFERQSPTPAALASLDAFLAQQMHRYSVPINRVYTHQELGPTECPGRSMQRYMVKTRSRGGQLVAMA